MKEGDLRNWNTDGSEESLLFVAQRLNELLFDYTLDSHKYYALNTPLLIQEALDRINTIKENSNTDQNLRDIIDEVNLKAQSDIITKAILKNEYDLFFPITLTNNHSEFSLKLELLYHRLNINKFLSTNFELLEKSLQTDSKKQLNILVSNLVTCLINVGYHQSYIYHQSNNLFFHGKTSKRRTFKHFVKLFPPKKKSYTVTLKASDSFLEIQKVVNKYKLSIISNLDITQYAGPSKSFISNLKKDQILIQCEGIRAYDRQSARLISLEQLSFFARLFTYFHHKNPPYFNREAIVTDNGRHYLMEPNISPMAKGEDMTHEDAGIFLEQFLMKFASTTKSTIRLRRAIHMHSQALTTHSNENRILSIWIAFESLFGGGKTTTVIHIINSLLHVCSLKYFTRIFSELSRSIKLWNTEEHNLIRTITNEANDIDAVCSFVCSQEYDQERKDLYAKLNSFPLLRFRIYDLNKSLCKTSKVLAFLEKHNQRIRWHLKRIYRTRNMIVHQGKTPTNIEILVENSHSYLDIFIDEFIMDNMFKETIRTIDQAVENYKILDNRWQKLLRKASDQEINSSNFKRFLLFKENSS